MKKLLLIPVLLGALALAGCKTTQEEQVTVISNRGYVIEIPNELLQCNVLAKYPNPETLSDSEVSDILIALAKENQFCANNMQKIRDFIKRAKATMR